MKRIIMALALMGLLFGGGAAAWAVVGTPEIDNANATISVPISPFSSVTCAGEDSVDYVTFSGAWIGHEIDKTPGSTDYSLTGPWNVKNVVWTINLKTMRGVLTGTAMLKSAPASGGPLKTTYNGPLTLITQGLPSSAGNGVPARGWINAPTFTAGVKDGGSVLANVEAVITPGFGLSAQFGDAVPSLGFPDWSVATANKSC
jgi:hypothetical protein